MATPAVKRDPGSRRTLRILVSLLGWGTPSRSSPPLPPTGAIPGPPHRRCCPTTAFFVGTGSHGDLGWSQFGETRGQMDLTFGASERVDLYAGAEVTRQQVHPCQPALGYVPVGNGVPPAANSNFSPTSSAGYLEGQLRMADLAFNGGLRYDQFNAGSELAVSRAGPSAGSAPRAAVSTVLAGATFVASYGETPAPAASAGGIPISVSRTPPNTS